MANVFCITPVTPARYIVTNVDTEYLTKMSVLPREMSILKARAERYNGNGIIKTCTLRRSP
jgi:hypothetical protein